MCKNSSKTTEHLVTHSDVLKKFRRFVAGHTFIFFRCGDKIKKFAVHVNFEGGNLSFLLHTAIAAVF